MNIKELVVDIQCGRILPLDLYKIFYNSLDSNVRDFIIEEINKSIDEVDDENSCMAMIKHNRCVDCISVLKNGINDINSYIPKDLLDKYIEQKIKEAVPIIINKTNFSNKIKKEVESCVAKAIKEEFEEKIAIQTLCERWHCSIDVIQNYIKRGLLSPKRKDNCMIFNLKDIVELEDEGLAKKYK